jgi:hypothetical protein
LQPPCQQIKIKHFNWLAEIAGCGAKAKTTVSAADPAKDAG